MVVSREYDLVTLVTRAQAGDVAAFDTVFEHFADPMYRYVYAHCGDAHLAEDLTGDLWVKVVEHLPTFRFRHTPSDVVFRAWLYRIARNLITDFYRRSGHQSIPLIETTPSSDISLDDHVIQDEARQHVHESMKHLTVDQREVIFLRFIEERSIAEVVALIGRSEGAVKLLQYRGLDALARVFGVQRRRKRS